ncbi:hypothetical protein KAFR_0K00470 [Kazachstania africana CBS 2517]|uniref:Endoplasmic reticulum-Golgi intermediate compartment protein n=1 Tax=Kazachstania africana (strain ATCC 22294 / BCRC 22015 / CBS 2517 / CECT 1963 / NBRC 1671 / NRRL Y-8276) TaxID=1071382 RepID=H2B1A2_KAZAF|nr:hypothetical protein KAFR_0K00470 [Kazachstania africana CBS 2517]CCF60402.1 hypothetical protein KAFR_0K00470 [Kazachstania africana CBS 2517]
MRRSKLLVFDAFNKTEEDVRVRTNTGGLISIGCVVLTCFLLLREWYQFNEIITRPKLVVDRDHDLELDLNFDITFPSISCDLLTLDILDDAGDLQLDLLESGLTKTRVDSNGVSLTTESFNIGNEALIKRDFPQDYCGSCYGALDQGKNDELNANEKVCCQTCEDVHDAYLNIGWAFYDGKNIEQCETEGYVDRINEHLNEGCRVQGSARLNRVQGNIHFAPGKSYQDYSRRNSFATHFHDTSLYDKTHSLSFNHIIHHFSFGKPIENSYVNNHNEGLSKISTNPLDGRKVFPDRDSHFIQYSYFAEIVPTRYEYLNNKSDPVETTQFSATFHSRPLRGGRDEDHPTTLHQRGGIPGLFIYFETSPLKVINKEQYSQAWSTFLLNCITTIGGILAVGTSFDKITYKAQRTIWGKKNK